MIRLSLLTSETSEMREKAKETKRGVALDLGMTVQNVSPQEILMPIFVLLVGLELSLAHSCQRWGL